MLECLDVKNFKCFLTCSLHFTKANILVGVNSGGKSSIIQSLLFFKTSIQGNQAKKSIDLLDNEFGLNLYSFDEIFNKNTSDEDEFFSIKVTNDKKNIELKYMPTDEENVLVIEAKHKDIFLGDVIYLNSERYISRDQKHGSLNNIKLGPCNQYLAYILEKGQKKQIPIYNDRNHWEHMATKFLDLQINEWLNYILPSNKVSARNSRDCISLIFGDNLNLHQTNVGYGVSFILPIIIAGLIAKTGSILIVENPELHLHPRAQSAIAEFLAIVAKSGVQVIIETHSDHIINGFRKAILFSRNSLTAQDVSINYFNIKQEESSIQKIELTNKAEFVVWPEGFMDQEEDDLHLIRRMRLIHE